VPLEIATPDHAAETLGPKEVNGRRAASRHRAAGILLHRVLELWDGKSDVEPLLRELRIEAAADGDSVSRVRRRLATIARSPMLQRIAAAETVGREVPVRFVENGATVERRIDRLIREEDGYVVVDYKSGRKEGSRADKDKEQVARYCQAIRDLTGARCTGVLWYVGLDGESEEWI